MQSYSIAEVGNRFANIVEHVEHTSSVEVTRQGKPVAIIISIDEYRQLKHRKPSFWDAYLQFQASTDWSDAEIEPEFFDNLRERATA